uniref:Uncharacterized protein n=1 Tax=Rheinheimera sp. BAL341 TaxID=1708203 RepID=A0A486XSK8_9GAMM
MKKVIFAAALCSYAVAASATIEPMYMNRPTFNQLLSKAESFNDTKVGMMGVLSLNADGRVYLCESLDACLSWNPNKLEVDKAALEDYLGDDYKLFDRCHVHVFGTYIRDEAKDFAIRIGLLAGELLRLTLSISREDYADFNPHCAVWNKVVETSKKTGNEKMLLELIDRFKYKIM